MSGAGAAPFSPERLAALSRLSREINGRNAPTPISDPVVLHNGRVTLPVPDHAASETFDPRGRRLFEQKLVNVEMHLGLTMQWASMAAQGGALIEFRGGEPDGVENRDAVAVFLTARGLRGLADDLRAIADAISDDGGAV